MLPGAAQQDRSDPLVPLPAWNCPQVSAENHNDTISICSSTVIIDRTLLTRSRTPMHNDKHRRSISSARAFSSAVRSSGFFLKMGLRTGLAVAGVAPKSGPASASCYHHY